MIPEVEVHLEWMDEPGLHVSHDEGRISVRVCPSVSQAQVEASCSELGEYGDVVYAGWQRAVGIRGESEESF